MDSHSYTPLYRRMLLATAMLVIGLITAAALIRFSESVKVKDKPDVGVVKGVVYSPPNSCAVVGKEMVHVGDEIQDIAVVGIQSNTVEFSKAGVTWQQQILETPHRAWKNLAKADSSDVK
jgi:hypothetical protein